MAAALSLVAWLGAHHPPPSGNPTPDVVFPPLSAGWEAVHRLDLREPSAAAVVSLLAATPTLERRGQRLILQGNAVPLEQRLAQAGWQFSRETESGGPRGSLLQVYAPTGEQRWSGTYDSRGLEEPGAALLTTALLSATARGQSLPPTVPIGCRPLPSSAP